MLPDIILPICDTGALSSLSASGAESELQITRICMTMIRNKGDRAPKNPDLIAHLHEVAKPCDNLEPNFMNPAIVAALGTRQHSRKSPFIRGFAALLRQRKIRLTPPL